MKHAIALALRDSFRLNGRMGRRDYLLFMVFAVFACSASVFAAWSLRDHIDLTTSAAAIAAIFFLPVTTAGARRLQDTGEEGITILAPIGIAAAVIAIGAFLVFSIWGLVALTILALLLAPPVGILLAIMLALPFWLTNTAELTVAEASALYQTLYIIIAILVSLVPFTHIAGQLLLPTQPGPNKYGAQPSKVLS